MHCSMAKVNAKVCTGGEESNVTQSIPRKVQVGVVKNEQVSASSTPGTVSLSQILERSVYSGCTFSSSHKSVTGFKPLHGCTPMPSSKSTPIGKMGNGLSNLQSNSSGEVKISPGENGLSNTKQTMGPIVLAALPEDYNHLKESVSELKRDLKERDVKLDALTIEGLNLRRQLKKKNEDIVKLQQEIHKLKSVLQLKTSPSHEVSDVATTLNTLAVNGSVSAKKQGVSAQSFPAKTSDKILIQHVEKDFQSKQLIREAILDNDFLKHLDNGQIREIVDSMYQETFEAKSWVIQEGTIGSHLFVSAEGELEVLKEEKVLGKVIPGKAFGELALLYNCTRTASVRAVTKARVWALERSCFQHIMMREGLQRLEANISFLTSIPLFKSLNSEHIAKIADSLELDTFGGGSYIIRQGTGGDSFYIIRSGKVKVTQKVKDKKEDQVVRMLERGNYFGEQALLKRECRSANVIAMNPGVECLTLDRNSFKQLIGDLSELKEKDYGDETRGALQKYKIPHNVNKEQEFSHVRLSDLEVISTLGVGGFGRVELVQNKQNKTETFALKCLKKCHIIETQQQEHIYSEKRIMMSVRSPFICRLYKTFRDSKCVYMLIEACLGGEVWTILRDRGWFEDNVARFVIGCVLEALEYLHLNNIIYRDLKPENLLLDARGYVKLVDFGFSKEMNSNKTWTFCGTPEYVAPEIILNKGHDRAVDYWAVGVLMFELLTGTPPFSGANPIKTYNIILRGMDLIEFPSHVSRHAISLIRRLCKEHPAERLGYQRGGIMDIKNHRWFQGFDWEGLTNQTAKPPIIPKIRSPSDATNFDSYARDTEVPPDELSGWDLDF